MSVKRKNTRHSNSTLYHCHRRLCPAKQSIESTWRRGRACLSKCQNICHPHDRWCVGVHHRLRFQGRHQPCNSDAEPDERRPRGEETLIPSKQVSWRNYSWPIFFAIGFVAIIVLLESRRALGGAFDGLKGGTQAGLLFAYAGTLLIVGAQFYTLVKRSAWMGVNQECRWRPTLALDSHHIEFLRADRRSHPRRVPLPFQFRRTCQSWSGGSDNLATYRVRRQRSLRTVHPQEIARDEEDLRLLETNALSHNRTALLRRDHSHDHSLRRLTGYSASLLTFLQ